MLNKFTDYDYYVNKYKGTIDECDFDKLVIQVSNYINYATSNRIDKDNIPEQVKYCTCSIIDLMQEQNNKIAEIGTLKSQNIEGWSESYATPEEIKTQYESRIREVLRQSLWNVFGIDGQPLLYMGVV